MINNNLLIEFTKNTKNYISAPKTLEQALMNNNIINFLNKNSITFDTPIDGLKISCVLGLIMYSLKLEIHILGEKTISDAIGIINNETDIGYGRFERWLNSETLFDFYENTIPILKKIKLSKLKINAITIINDVVMKQSELDGEDYDKRPLDRFKVKEHMLHSQEYSFTEKRITPKMVIEARKIAELTQKQSAELVCVDERTWQRWESGDRNMSRGIYKLYLIETKQI